jgi:fatty acid synthase subunit alpha, fungi type
MRAISPQSTGGNLLKLVHLSNSFCLVSGARGACPLKVGDICKAEALIVSITNTNAGKAVKVKDFVTRNSQPIIEVVSSFPYYDRFEDYNNTFELLKEPNYLIEITSDAAIGILKLNEWFDWHKDTKPF